MKTRLVTFSMVAVFAIALALEGFAATREMRNENTSTNAAQRARSRAKKKMMRGVPSGVDNCMKHLAEMAAMDPMPDYEGHPSEIINNGLLWNDAKSKCSVGDDQAKRKRIFDLATAWRKKDAATVRSILQELGASSGGGK